MHILTGDGEVACGNQTVATPGDVTFDLGDRGLGAVQDVLQNGHQRHRPLRGERLGVRRGRTLEVGTGAEGPALGGQHYHADLGILAGADEAVGQRGHRFGVEDVARVRLVQGERGDAVGDLVPHLRPIPSSKAMTRSMTSSAPPPMDVRRESRKYRAGHISSA